MDQVRSLQTVQTGSVFPIGEVKKTATVQSLTLSRLSIDLSNIKQTDECGLVVGALYSYPSDWYPSAQFRCVNQSYYEDPPFCEMTPEGLTYLDEGFFLLNDRWTLNLETSNDTYDSDRPDALVISAEFENGHPKSEVDLFIVHRSVSHHLKGTLTVSDGSCRFVVNAIVIPKTESKVASKNFNMTGTLIFGDLSVDAYVKSHTDLLKKQSQPQMDGLLMTPKGLVSVDKEIPLTGKFDLVLGVSRQHPALNSELHVQGNWLDGRPQGDMAITSITGQSQSFYFGQITIQDGVMVFDVRLNVANKHISLDFSALASNTEGCKKHTLSYNECFAVDIPFTCQQRTIKQHLLFGTHGLVWSNSDENFQLMDGVTTILRAGPNLVFHVKFCKGVPTWAALFIGEECHHYEGIMTVSDNRCTFKAERRLCNGHHVVSKGGVCRRDWNNNNDNYADRLLNEKGTARLGDVLITATWKKGHPIGPAIYIKQVGNFTTTFTGSLVFNNQSFVYHGQGRSEIRDSISGKSVVVEGVWERGKLLRRLPQSDNKDPECKSDQPEQQTDTKGTALVQAAHVSAPQVVPLNLAQTILAQPITTGATSEKTPSNSEASKEKEAAIQPHDPDTLEKSNDDREKTARPSDIPRIEEVKTPATVQPLTFNAENSTSPTFYVTCASLFGLSPASASIESHQNLSKNSPLQKSGFLMTSKGLVSGSKQTPLAGKFKLVIQVSCQELPLNRKIWVIGNWVNGFPQGKMDIISIDGKASSFYSGQVTLQEGTMAFKVQPRDSQWHDGFYSYAGQTNNGKPSGIGVSTWPNGDCFIGELVLGKLHGSGIFYWGDKEGHRYEGEFKNGQRTGQGTYYLDDGRSVMGQWKAGKVQGKVTLTIPQKRIFRGPVDANFEPNGDGRVQWWNPIKNSWSDTESFKKNTSGFAVPPKPIVQPSKTVPTSKTLSNYLGLGKYHGSVNGADFPHGFGMLTLENNVRFEGTWNNGKPEGEFTIIYSDEETFIGSVLLDEPGEIQEGATIQPHGNGELKLRNGCIIKAHWTHSVIDKDKVSLTYESGYVYEGQINDQYCPDGQGKMKRDNDDVSYEGTWENDKPVYLTINFPDGTWYQGQVNEVYQPHGQGKLVCGEESYEGEFENGQFKPRDGAIIKKNQKTYQPVGEYDSDAIDKMTFYGQMDWEDVWRYAGGIEAGEPDFWGVMQMGDEFTYQGRFEGGAAEGTGWFVDHKLHTVYHGMFVKGQIFGPGRMYLSDGTIYQANFTPENYISLNFEQGEIWSNIGGYHYQGSIHEGEAGWGSITILSSGVRFNVVPNKESN